MARAIHQRLVRTLRVPRQYDVLAISQQTREASPSNAVLWGSLRGRNMSEEVVIGHVLAVRAGHSGKLVVGLKAADVGPPAVSVEKNE
jgi:hypothetical protein